MSKIIIDIIFCLWLIFCFGGMIYATLITFGKIKVKERNDIENKWHENLKDK